MNVDQMRLFLEVVSLGSFQQAAEHNYISQRAVSQQMKKLEDQLGAPLFIREHNHIRLTAAGVYFRQRCETIVTMIEDMTGKVKNLKFATSKKLHAGYFSPFDAMLLRDQLLKLPQDTNFTLTEEGVENLVTDVLLGNLDCAMVMDDYGFQQDFARLGLATTTLHEDTMVIGVGDRLNLADKVWLKDIQDLPVLYYSSENSTYLKESFLASLDHGMRTFDVQRAHSYEQMQMLVSMGEAIAFYPQKLITCLANPTEPIRYLIPEDYQARHFTFKLMYNQTNPNESLKELLKQVKRSGN